MKTIIRGKIVSLAKIDGETHMTIQGTGKSEDPERSRMKQDATFDSTLVIKDIIADHMKIGAIFCITISDEESI